MRNEQYKRKNILDIHVGDVARLSRTITENDVIQMAKISGDYNPIHTDIEYAKQTTFGDRIAHGLFCCGMVSAVLGNELPGIGTIILSEEMKFMFPVYLEDTITAEVCVTSVNIEKKRIELVLKCTNQNGKTVMKGTTLVKLG